VSNPIRVRIAPSPTGAIHLGLARTALFNWAYAQHHGGTFVLRVEDTDRERSTAESEKAILEGLRWLGTEWDEGPDVGGPHEPYHQSRRIATHLEAAAELLSKGHAYRCFCTKDRLDEVRARQEAAKETPRYDRHCVNLDPEEVERRRAAGEPSTIRFRVPAGETHVDDLVRGHVVFANEEIDDWVMVRADETPTYNFVVVCDDAAMKITHVFRGEEHLVNTPKQVLLYQALKLAIPAFGHLPLMLGKDGKKLSKRHGAVSLSTYREEGYARCAVVNFLARQGWALDGETEIFSVEEFTSHFDIGAVSKGGSIFDFDKFAWMSGEYVHRESLEELGEHCAPFVIAAGLMTEAELGERREWYLAAIALGQERIRLYAEMPATIEFLFAGDDDLPFDPKAEKNARKHENRVSEMEAYRDHLRELLAGGADAAALREDGKAWIAERGLKFPQLFQPLRCALTGKAGGPDLFDVITLLGPERTLSRLEKGMVRLAEPQGS
jgi:nondiscriminating glutamyl-tRNA synthetase